LSEVWGQEPELRRDTIEWLYSFQLSAYSGLSDADIEAYTAFSETEAGAALNAALFAAFDTVFNQLSFRAGRRGGGLHRGRGRLRPSACASGTGALDRSLALMQTAASAPATGGSQLGI
jgi:hypothetical protein